jgi:hypothetical protein
MPIGFPAYSEDKKKFPDVEREDLARAVKRAFKDLNWNPSSESKFRIIGHVPFRIYMIFLIFGAKMTVEVKEGAVNVRSEGSFPLEWLDVGQHTDAIQTFMKALKRALKD